MEQEQFYSFHNLMKLDCVDAGSGMYQGINAALQDGEHERVYGGHLLAQALMAAFHTVPDDRLAHNLHAYFIRPGDMKLTNQYRVTRTRDGRSFSARQVDVLQQDKVITSMDISFCEQEDGLRHQVPAPAVPAPENLDDRETQMWQYIEVKPILGSAGLNEAKSEPYAQEWLRVRESIGDNQRLQQCAFTFISDFSLMDVAFAPHGVGWTNERVQSVSLDHAVWFHKPIHADEWLLFVQESPIAFGGRGFNRGTVFTRDGELVASLAQEGLMRVPQKLLDEIS